MNAKFDLDERLIKFSVSTLDIVEQMVKSKTSNHLGGQLIRSCTAPALIYGEVSAAESDADFIHKLSMVLKELRETRNCLKIIEMRSLVPASSRIELIIDECSQLISIIGASIATVRRRVSHDG